jgi:hypothetical protein
MSPLWSLTDITTVEVSVEYEEEYGTCTFDSTKRVSPALLDLSTLLGRSFHTVYEKVMYLCKS